MSASDVQRPPGCLDHLLIPENVIRNTIAGLSYAAGREMLCYWLGTEVQSKGGLSALVTTVAFPHIESAYAQFRVVEGQLGLITTWCAEKGLWILAQVHTHPTDEPHSESDECWPASQRRGFISVVFPFFATLSSLRTPGWRAYESAGGGVWSEIDTEQRFQIVTDVWLPPSGARR